jgi:quercetin dioxygenase-like cupin family protein
MKSYRVFIAAAALFPAGIIAQEQTAIPLKSEPHHHLVFHNDLVNVYTVQVPPHDTVQLHKHETDAIGIVLSNTEITVRSPGKPDSHQNVVNGQMRLQTAGYVHSTSIDGENAYRNMTVELLQPQESPRNLCAEVMGGKPLDCPKEETPTGAEVPEFETSQTRVTLVHIPPGQQATLETHSHRQLLVVLDEVSAVAAEKSSATPMHPGDFLWRDANAAAETFANDGSKEARVAVFAFQIQKPAK